MKLLEFNTKVKGRVIISEKSLHLELTEVNSGQTKELVIVRIPRDLSLCMMFKKWKHALEEIEMTDTWLIVNPVEFRLQLSDLKNRIQEHENMDCVCDNDSETSFFRYINYQTKKNSILLKLGINSAHDSKIVEHLVADFPTALQFLEAIKSLLESGAKHANFENHDLLNLQNIRHTGLAVVLAIGQIAERFFGELHLEDQKLDIMKHKSDIESLLKQAIHFQKNVELA